MGRPGRTAVLSVLILVTQVIAIVCQFIQSTDPRFPFLYFTVDSAALAALSAALTVAGCRAGMLQPLRLAAAVGVVLSAIVFATVIAPATPTGTWFQPHDDIAVRTATVLMHGVAPVLVLADYVKSPTRFSIRESFLLSYLWPMLYIAGLLTLAAVVGTDVIPYPFLLPSVLGWPVVAGAVSGLVIVVGALGAALGLATRYRRGAVPQYSRS